MKIIGEPDSYSEMLERIFVTTLATGVLSTLALSAAAPEVKRLLESISSEAEIGPIKGLKALYVFIPLVLALVSRMFKLHDRLSDLFGIRQHFDVRHILQPLVNGVGLKPTPALQKRLATMRQDAMYAVFYKYAGFHEPVIDRQLIRSALDSWGWFWVLLESVTLVFLTSFFFALISAAGWLVAGISLAVLECLGMLALWQRCIRCAAVEVRAILQDSNRKTAIKAYFETLAV